MTLKNKQWTSADLIRTGDNLGMLVDFDVGSVTFYINGVAKGTTQAEWIKTGTFYAFASPERTTNTLTFADASDDGLI